MMTFREKCYMNLYVRHVKISCNGLEVEMCKGAHNFVVAYNAEVQMAFGYRTSPVSNQLGEQKLAEHAVSSFKFSQPLDEPSHFRMELNQQLPRGGAKQL